MQTTHFYKLVEMEEKQRALFKSRLYFVLPHWTLSPSSQLTLSINLNHNYIYILHFINNHNRVVFASHLPGIGIEKTHQKIETKG